MIERKLLAAKIKEFQIQSYVSDSLDNAGHSHTKVQRTPLGEKIVLFAARPGLIVGRKGESIKKLTKSLKKKFSLENPQLEISEVTNVNLDARIVAERIASSLERFGSARFKAIGHRAMNDVMNSGALGIEILFSGKIPGARAKTWRFYQGYLKKCGDVAVNDVLCAYAVAKTKLGVIGIQVRIMPPNIFLPDKIDLRNEEQIAQLEKETAAAEAEKPKKKAKKKTTKKKTTKKKAVKKEAPKETAEKPAKEESKAEPKAEKAAE